MSKEQSNALTAEEWLDDKATEMAYIDYYNFVNNSEKQRIVTLTKRWLDEVSEFELKVLAAKLIQLPFDEKMRITESVEAFDKWIEENL